MDLRSVSSSKGSIKLSGSPSSDSSPSFALQSVSHQITKISFSSFKQSFTSNVNYLKRRFSSGDLSECDDNPEAAAARAQQHPEQHQQHQNQQQQQQRYAGQNAAAAASAQQAPTGQNNADLSLPLRPSSRTTSAPTSPAKSRESLLQRVSSLTGVGRQQQQQQQQQQHDSSAKLPYNKDRCFTLLVIDDQNTDWSKYFRGRKIHGDWDIRVEQAEFREISTSASSETGVVVSLTVYRNGAKVARAFRPDFVLVRQNMRDASEDYKSVILALMYGGIPSVNSLESLFNFQDKPWVYGHLLQLQRRLGRENFPLIEQTFYPTYREMLSAPRLPAVVKIGHAHGGLGKLKVETSSDFQDAASVVAVANTYCTVEPYVDAKFDVHVQKIGNYYKAFMRKSISGNWKTNQGSAMLEQLPISEKYRNWIDAVCDQFGGLDLCALEILVAKDGREIIIELNDCALPLLGDTQEEDRRLIAELVLHRMHTQCQAPGVALPKVASFTQSVTSSRAASPVEDRIPPAPAPSDPPIRRSDSVSSNPASSSRGPTPVQQQQQQQQQRDVLGGNNPFLSGGGAIRKTEESGGVQASAAGLARSIFGRQGSSQQDGGVDDGEDTMKNLRKTFAGIFGDM